MLIELIAVSKQFDDTECIVYNKNKYFTIDSFMHKENVNRGINFQFLGKKWHICVFALDYHSAP